MTKPTVSFIMPTLNSQRTIRASLQSIRSQDFDPKKIEILVIDGGSTDATLQIAREFQCRVLSNPRIQQEYAKHIGLLQAKGDYAVFLDSDEEFSSKQSLTKRIDVLKKNPKVHIVFSGGYKSTSNSLINRYVASFGDPFGYFMYNTSPNFRHYVDDCKKMYPSFTEDRTSITFRINEQTFLPLVDLCAGVTVDMSYVRKRFDLHKDILWVPKLPAVTIREDGYFMVVKDEYIIHDSAESIAHFMNKLKWRAIVNVHYKDIPGTGYANREELQPRTFNLKKYLFILYAASVAGPVVTTLYSLIRRRNTSSVLHPFLTLFVLVSIVANVFAKIAGHKPSLHVYGKK